MLIKKIITSSFLAALLAMSFASCTSDTTSDVPTPTPNKAYLQVQVNVEGNQSTRADYYPQGGEDGNGREVGLENENQINNLSLLLYSTETGSTETIEEVYNFLSLTKVTEGSNQTWRTGMREVDPLLVSKNYHVLVVTNAGNMNYLKGKNVSDVKDLVMDQVCTSAPSIKDFSDFVMSSNKDAQLTTTPGSTTIGSGTEEDPYLVTVDVERLAARIEIEPNADYSASSYYYPVMDGNDVVGGFQLQSVVPTKVLTSGEYLFNHVDGDYVICPWTADRTPVTYASDSFRPSSFYQVRDVNKGGYFILDYVMENTSKDNDVNHSTGLLFKGKYYKEDQWDKTNCCPKAGATGTDKEYPYTIRHCDPEGTCTTADPMYYGIVRNNIYHIKIEGVTGKSEGLKLKINVRKWATYTHEETTM